MDDYYLQICKKMFESYLKIRECVLPNIYKRAYEFQNYNVLLSWLLYRMFFFIWKRLQLYLLASFYIRFRWSNPSRTVRWWWSIKWEVYHNYFMTMCGAISQYAKAVIFGKNMLFFQVLAVKRLLMRHNRNFTKIFWKCYFFVFSNFLLNLESIKTVVGIVWGFLGQLKNRKF